ncbi:hypothetical protein NX80_013365 [Xanthomonas vasicola pv. arecae]|nr:hypothetical protein NX80_013365 [Xanthomonas vasicola pv. arecae]AZR30921.1 hypothetical protein KWO_010660 [Xanthomonas vasicola pv. musacearum NCPPB 4379]AZR34995.1 hypothetical protein NX08_011460 [Xanthomonas vasicola]RRJ38791.1 hypothetical protein EIM46_13975 [Xanthomonas vasicola pv. musacearum]RRJ59642.1 hypothetical protein EIM45_15190 [Xanthomonas vasicola pv. musacearum]
MLPSWKATAWRKRNFSMQSMSDIQQDCKNFRLALDALYSKEFPRLKCTSSVTRRDRPQKKCNRLRNGGQ